MENQYFVVLENSTPGSQTVYPEVHHVFADDAFAPELDIVERNPGDISVLVDLDESGQRILGCQSIAPEWQVIDASLVTQALDTSSGTASNSRLLQITGIPAKLNQDIVSLKGDFDTQMTTGFALIEQLERRNEELKKAISSYNEDRRR